MVRLWCEYDYGQDDCVFSTVEKAEAWMRAAILSIHGDDPDFDFDLLKAEELLGTDTIDFDPDPY